MLLRTPGALATERPVKMTHNTFFINTKIMGQDFGVHLATAYTLEMTDMFTNKPLFR